MQMWMRASLVALAATAGACGPSLQNGYDSPETLAAAVLDALAARDEAALRRMALDEGEFREQVWPELPASRPERKMPFSYVWTDLQTKSDLGRASVLAEHGGRRYDLRKVRFAGETSRYDSFLVHRESIVDVRDQDGRDHALQLFGSMIQKGGRFKVFSYVVD